MIIEKVTGITYEEYMEESIMKPLGLNNTYLAKNDSVNKRIAQGYKIEFLKPRLYDYTDYKGNKPAGHIISNAEDMAKWLKIQMGTLDTNEFNKDLIADSHKHNNIKESGTGSYYASGWYVREKDDVIIYHAGENPNYSSFVVFNPEKKVGVVVLSNISSSHVTAVADGIYGILIGKEYDRNIMDKRKTADVAFVIITFIASLVMLLTVYFIIKIFRQMLNKEREYHKKDIQGLVKSSFSTIFIVGLSYCLYILPHVFMGFSWKSVYMWFPKSVISAKYLVYASIWLVYIHLMIKSFYKKVIQNDMKQINNSYKL